LSTNCAVVGSLYEIQKYKIKNRGLVTDLSENDQLRNVNLNTRVI